MNEAKDRLMAIQIYYGVNLYFAEVTEVEEQTSHYVQLEDGTYAQMVDGHDIVKPGQQMLVIFYHRLVVRQSWFRSCKTYIKLLTTFRHTNGNSEI
jgi:hypothetical protein